MAKTFAPNSTLEFVIAESVTNEPVITKLIPLPDNAILTIGHSTRSMDVFISMLQHFGVKMLADVRTMPRSRHNPQYNSDALAKSLSEAGIGYAHMKPLGGMRKPDKNSVNTGWKNESFRGYADYMQTKDFADALAQLTTFAAPQRIAIMCAEAVPWRCHRSLVADVLLVHGIPVFHIMSETLANPHKLTSFAQVRDKHLTYPPPDDLLTPLTHKASI